MDRLDEMLVSTARTLAEDVSLSAPERLSRIISHHVRLVREHKGLPILLFAEASTSDDPVLLSRMRAIFKDYFALLVGVIDEGQGSGTIDPAVQSDCLALGLMGTPAALAVRHRLLPDAGLEDRVEDVWIPFLLERIAPQQERQV